MMKTVTIYTDGACSGNPGPGGWGRDFDVRPPQPGALRRRGRHHQPHGAHRRDQALSLLKEPCIVDLWSDSKICDRRAGKGWAKGWRRLGGWKKADKPA